MGVFAAILLIIAIGFVVMTIYGFYLKDQEKKKEIIRREERRKAHEESVKKYMEKYESYSKDEIQKELERMNKDEIRTQLARSQANINAMKTNNYFIAPRGMRVNSEPVRERFGDPKAEALNKLLRMKS